MKFYFLTICFILISILSYSQTICFKIDSITCYRIPWQIKSPTDIHENELIRGEESISRWRDHKTIIDKTPLNFFSEINLADTNILLNTKQQDYFMDARAVIILYLSNGSTDTIVFNSSAGYSFSNKIYLANTKLLLWLMEYIPLHERHFEFFGPKEANQMKKEENFMVETISKK